jgi:hypothetical protein
VPCGLFRKCNMHDVMLALHEHQVSPADTSWLCCCRVICCTHPLRQTKPPGLQQRLTMSIVGMLTYEQLGRLLLLTMLQAEEQVCSAAAATVRTFAVDAGPILPSIQISNMLLTLFDSSGQPKRHSFIDWGRPGV